MNHPKNLSTKYPSRKAYALVDGNNFFASCEQVFNPKLLRKPIGILSNNDGCIIARSNELKQLGVPMGTPKFKWNKFLQSHDVHLFSANFSLYGDMSKRMMMTLTSIVPSIEIYSIDEAFLDCSMFPPSELNKLATRIYQTVPRWIGIPVGVGIAPTKVLAKIANHFSKKHQCPFVIYFDKIADSLRDLPIKDVWGIGRRLTKKMNALGIFTAYDFYKKDEEWVKQRFSIIEQKLHKELQGKPVLHLNRTANKKSICVSRSFEKSVSHKEYLFDAVSCFLNSAVEKLRRQESLAGLLHIFIQTNRFHKGNYYSGMDIIRLTHTNETSQFLQSARRSFDKIWKPHSYKRAGVILSDFISIKDYQPTFFENENLNPKLQKLQKTIDTINKTHAKQQMGIASVGHLMKNWKMNRKNLSPAYTTRIEDLIKIHI
ncbi:protein UmuC-like [Ylistrum balloti]|uniref:protein UmuC-like n=1 Tax=Ylistrum balloti TaxID=509963 RepID=UPI002905A17D|nr:protein UmuC-like [Ylistrum balloti]